MKKIRSTVNYILQRKYVTLYGLSFASIITIILILYSVNSDNYVWYAAYFDPFATVVTLILAIILWFSNADRDRQNNLPQKLTVKFIYRGRDIAKCERAYLAGEGDIRAWGQQIGKQILHTGILKMDPYIAQGGPIVTSDESGKEFKLYSVHFYLKEKPALDYYPKDNSRAQSRAEFSAKLDTHCVVWNPDEDDYANPTVEESWIKNT